MKDSTKRKIKHIGVMLFLLYVLLLVYFTVADGVAVAFTVAVFPL